MNEENKNVSKNGWKRIFGKKWFFPAVYLTVAALLLTGVLWYQNLDNQLPGANEDSEQQLDNEYLGQNPAGFDEESEAVMEQQEVLKMPVVEESQAEIVTKFYDYDADSEDQLQALVLYNNKYYQSKGVDIASADGEVFDVTASLSGTVTEVKEDPLLGHVVKIEHQNGIMTYYASLQDVLVETGAKVKQGDTIGSAGQNLFSQASGTHVHFEVRKDDAPVNPEQYFNQPVSQLEVPSNQQDNTDQGTEETDQDSEDETGGDADEETSSTNTESSAAMANA
ncbi:peptidoglycan DD-metalloendopeptidase family protein [Aquibacillus halophilus]|uniref:Peptidoglycan DD-metalloendopeptidase family protein n=1 Tax=Aquibacillus halophilus TaxID=930132 RepID=A0A6A8DJL7_9BACI|nr:M23 family metallopeptidase [Aquibacillus halophilus]MRH43951.1 peptidoglycan DD-metalloendopeptidase family protein [Aquibacillus halophilus]